MTDVTILDEINIEDIIYEIRGKQVLLDSDLAKLYHVETKRINEAVKNNPDKFPERFCFKITNEESKTFLVEIFDQKKKLEVEDLKIPEYSQNRELPCLLLY